MAPKKPWKPNGFLLFAMDLKSESKRQISTKEACDAAAPLWAGLNKEQRREYDNKAKAMRRQESRLTSEGLDADQLFREKQLEAQAEEQKKDEIKNAVLLAHRRGVLEDEVFFIIHCNIFCYHPTMNKFWPAEISVISFTLRDGVKQENIFHSLVEPGSLPVGYKFEAKQLSDETHQITVPMDDEVRNNQEEVLSKLMTFIQKKNSSSTTGLPVLFALEKYVKMIQRILDTWCEDYDNPKLFEVCNLQVLFYYLRNTVAGEPVWPSITISDRELDKDVYAYLDNIACEYHMATSKQIYCTHSMVIRYVYVICDNCCPDLNIDLVAGQHVPMQSTIPDGGSERNYSIISSKSSRKGGRSRRRNDNDETESTADTWETDSLLSDASSNFTVSNMNEHFPLLGETKSRSPNFEQSGSIQSSSGVRGSYAGAAQNTQLPVDFERGMANMSLQSNLGAIPKGRGFRRKNFDSDSDSSVSVTTSRNVSTPSHSDFPPLGRGRGFVRKGVQRPGV